GTAPGRGRFERSGQRAATCSAPSVARALTTTSAESSCQELPHSTTWTGTSAAAASSRSGASLCGLRALRTIRETPRSIRADTALRRSEEHTSELQSRFDLVCRLLLEKKKDQETVAA